MTGSGPAPELSQHAHQRGSKVRTQGKGPGSPGGREREQEGEKWEG